jgi:hypothetical protein
MRKIPKHPDLIDVLFRFPHRTEKGVILMRLLQLAVSGFITLALYSGCNVSAVVDEVEREVRAEDQVDQRFPEEGGMITDSVTGLQWKVGPDSDTDWMTASLWVENLNGEGWRMPSRQELLGLHDAGLNWHNWGPFDNDGQSVWSDSTSRYGAHAWLFDFGTGIGSMANTGDSRLNRGFAGRTPQ